jgi:glucose-6-phosphate isomerase
MLHRDIHLDFNEAIAHPQLEGITDAELGVMTASFIQVHRALHAMHEMGQVQFMHLPNLEETFQQVQVKADQLRQEFDVMVVLGIGGSGLGAKALFEATQGPFIPGMKLPGDKGLYVLDTLDPDYLGRLLEHLDFKRTVFNVVSKSGNTVETMAQFMMFYELLKETLGEDKFRKHIVMTTDAKKGTLRQICEEEGLESFEILPGVGGRFSVLSPVGLLPAAFIGVSIQELAEGAIRMLKRCSLEDLWTNPAAMMAVVAYLLAEKHSRHELVLFNYSESLQSVVEWFRQLWAESLGKRLNLQGKEVRAGITPIQASGPRDQHSQVQLYAEGPLDKMVMFWHLENHRLDETVPKIYSDVENLGYLGGRKLSEILDAEIRATEQALREAGVPSFKLLLHDRDPYTMGQLFYLLEVATVYVGGLLNVNPYDQPGVELGKKYLYGKLGRKGFEEFGAKLARKIKDKRYIV